MAVRAAAGRSRLEINVGRQHSQTMQAEQAPNRLLAKVVVTGAGPAAAHPRHQQLLGPVTLAACLLLGNAALQQPPPAAQAAASGAPAEHDAGFGSAAARLHLRRPVPCLAHISPLQLVGPAAAAEDAPTETGAAAEDEDIGTSLSGVLVFAVVCFILTRKSSSSRSSSGSNSRGDYFDWDEDDRLWNDDD